MRLACLSVDLDEIPCYTAIHGLPIPEGEAAHAIYRKALPRLLRLFDEEQVPCTFFAIGRDLEGEEGPTNASRLKAAHHAGHEIGNHSHHHLYDLTRRDRATMRAEVEGGARLIEEAVGARPVGFRAPGYTITEALLEVLSELGLAYDSSVFPCPPYYGAKAAAMGLIRLRGRRSRSVLDDPRVLLSPADPYRVGQPYWRRGEGLMELPIGVTRGPRLPYIGTSVVLSGPWGARLLSRAIAGRPLINLELHGIDLADKEEDGLSFLAPHQPDLRETAADKQRALRAAIGTLKSQGYRFVTLAEAAKAFA